MNRLAKTPTSAPLFQPGVHSCAQRQAKPHPASKRLPSSKFLNLSRGLKGLRSLSVWSLCVALLSSQGCGLQAGNEGDTKRGGGAVRVVETNFSGTGHVFHKSMFEEDMLREFFSTVSLATSGEDVRNAETPKLAPYDNMVVNPAAVGKLPDNIQMSNIPTKISEIIARCEKDGVQVTNLGPNNTPGPACYDEESGFAVLGDILVASTSNAQKALQHHFTTFTKYGFVAQSALAPLAELDLASQHGDWFDQASADEKWFTLLLPAPLVGAGPAELQGVDPQLIGTKPALITQGNSVLQSAAGAIALAGQAAVSFAAAGRMECNNSQVAFPFRAQTSKSGILRSLYWNLTRHEPNIPAADLINGAQLARYKEQARDSTFPGGAVLALAGGVFAVMMVYTVAVVTKAVLAYMAIKSVGTATATGAATTTTGTATATTGTATTIQAANNIVPFARVHVVRATVGTLGFVGFKEAVSSNASIAAELENEAIRLSEKTGHSVADSKERILQSVYEELTREATTAE